MTAPTMELPEFISKCEELASRSLPRSGVINGHRRNDVRSFRSPGLQIIKGGDDELEIIIIYRQTDGGIINNPVILRAADGRIYRSHGEWRYARRRLQRLLTGERPIDPITLGPCPNCNGLICGID